MTVAKLIDCPPRSALEAFHDGQLSIESAVLVREHVEKCPSCQVQLSSFGSQPDAPAEQTDTTDHLRTREQATDSVRAATNPGDAKAHGRTPTHAYLATGSDAVTEVPADRFRFLTPAIQPDEIGRLGSYRVLRVLGEGGMGIVFEAEDTLLARRVALKCLRPDVVSESIHKRFLQEARIAASLPHDHIVTIFQVGEAGNVPYLAMEYLHGETVQDRLKREFELPLADALRITREVAQGLHEAHVRGLIHRDIKPANVWLESDGAGGSFKRVKLLDFGVARPIASKDQLTQMGHVVGTPNYMSPEQACGLPVDARTDLFSLGCMLYRMLTGNLAFDGGDTSAVLSSLLNERPRAADSLNTKIPQPVLTLLNQLLSKDPNERPASAQIVVQRIRAIEAGEPDEKSAPLSDLLRATSTKTRIRERGKRWSFSWGTWIGVGSIVAALVVGVMIEYRRIVHAHRAAIFEKSKPTTSVPLGPAETAALADRPIARAVPVQPSTLPPVKIGVLHSLSGTMAASESHVASAVLMAVDEINQAGGVLGRQIDPVVVDGQSNDEMFASAAEQLIRRDRVAAIFGCWTSSSRKAVRQVVEAHDNVLFYPLQNEGLEESPNVIYLGACPNQQLIPAVKWAFAFLEKRRFFLIGSDYVYPHAANEIAKEELARLGATVVGETYVPLGATDLNAVIDQIVAARPDMILNTINGDSNVPFFRRLRAAGIKSSAVPTFSFSLAENGVRAMTAAEVEGDYVAWSYFQGLETPANEAFLRRCRKALGPTRAVTDPIEISYCGVYLWKQGAEAAQSVEPARARTALIGHAFNAPEGLIRVDVNHYCWRTPRVGRITAELQFDDVWSAPRPVAPVPFPPSRTRAEWEAFLDGLYQKWGNRWHNPAPVAGTADETTPDEIAPKTAEPARD